jgi:hypothetical protein
MPKLVLIYSFFAVVLFGALFAAFFISGLGEPAEEWTDYVEPPAPEPAPPPDPLAKGLDYPALESGRTYRVSHDTQLFHEIESEEGDVETLPAQGYFTVETTVDAGNRRWYRVVVSDGVRDFSRYILAKDLNFKRVLPARLGQQTDEERKQAILAELMAMAEERRQQRLAATPAPPPEPRTPQNWNEWWAMTASRVGGATMATVLASAAAAAIGTAVTIAAIVAIISFRREHTWDRPPTHDLDAEWAEATRDDADVEVQDPSAGHRW